MSVRSPTFGISFFGLPAGRGAFLSHGSPTGAAGAGDAWSPAGLVAAASAASPAGASAASPAFFAGSSAAPGCARTTNVSRYWSISGPLASGTGPARRPHHAEDDEHDPDEHDAADSHDAK